MRFIFGVLIFQVEFVRIIGATAGAKRDADSHRRRGLGDFIRRILRKREKNAPNTPFSLETVFGNRYSAM